MWLYINKCVSCMMEYHFIFAVLSDTTRTRISVESGLGVEAQPTGLQDPLNLIVWNVGCGDFGVFRTDRWRRGNTVCEGTRIKPEIFLKGYALLQEEELDVVLTYSLWMKPTDSVNSSFYWYYDSTCFGQPFCPSSGVFSLYRHWHILCRFDDRLLPGVGSCSW